MSSDSVAFQLDKEAKLENPYSLVEEGEGKKRTKWRIRKIKGAKERILPVK